MSSAAAGLAVARQDFGHDLTQMRLLTCTMYCRAAHQSISGHRHELNGTILVSGQRA